MSGRDRLKAAKPTGPPFAFFDSDVELEPFDAERHASARLSWPHHLPHIESHYRCMHDAAFLAACCDALRPEVAEA